MNKEEVIKEVIAILNTSNYIDTAEHLYDGLKQVKREVTYATVHDFLWALESSTVTDVDGRVTECANKIKRLLVDMTIDEAYENYEKSYEIGKHLEGTGFLWMAKETRETFIYRSKTHSDFSEKWGLKIKERELSLEERHDIKEQYGFDCRKLAKPSIKQLDDANIPTKLITLTYNNETIESYE